MKNVDIYENNFITPEPDYIPYIIDDFHKVESYSNLFELNDHSTRSLPFLYRNCSDEYIYLEKYCEKPDCYYYNATPPTKPIFNILRVNRKPKENEAPLVQPFGYNFYMLTPKIGCLTVDEHRMKVLKYWNKKARRTFIYKRYPCRRATALSRPRHKGRFISARGNEKDENAKSPCFKIARCVCKCSVYEC